MLKVKLSVLALVATLQGCATGVNSTSEVRLVQLEPTKACATVGNASAAANIVAGYKRCYMLPENHQTFVPIGGVIVPITARNTSFIRIEEEAARHSVVIGNSTGIQQVYDIQKTESCQSEVTARGATKILNYLASSAIRFADDPGASCKKP